MPRALGLFAAFSVALSATIDDMANAATPEPANFVWQTCTDFSGEFEHIVSAFEDKGWAYLSDREEASVGAQLAIAKVGLNVAGTPNKNQWQHALALRTHHVQAELQKVERDFYRSALVERKFSDNRELVFITWVRGQDQLVTLGCVYAGQTANNPEATNILMNMRESIGRTDQLVFYEQIFPETSVSYAIGTNVSITHISKHKAERAFGHALPADLGLHTQLNLRTGSQ